MQHDDTLRRVTEFGARLTACAALRQRVRRGVSARRNTQIRRHENHFKEALFRALGHLSSADAAQHWDQAREALRDYEVLLMTTDFCLVRDEATRRLARQNRLVKWKQCLRRVRLARVESPTTNGLLLLSLQAAAQKIEKAALAFEEWSTTGRMERWKAAQAHLSVATRELAKLEAPGVPSYRAFIDAVGVAGWAGIIATLLVGLFAAALAAWGSALLKKLFGT